MLRLRLRLQAPLTIGMVMFAMLVTVGLLDSYVLHPDRLGTLGRPPVLFFTAIVGGIIVAVASTLAKFVRPHDEIPSRIHVSDFIWLMAIMFVVSLLNVRLAVLGRGLVISAVAAAGGTGLAIAIWRVVQRVQEGPR